MGLVEVPVSRNFSYPIAESDAWLTDFREDGGAIAGALMTGRDHVGREGDVVRMATRIRRPFGAERVREQVVQLFPRERRWESRIVSGYGAGSFHRYQLREVPGGTRLDIVFGFGARSPLHELGLALAKPLLRRQLVRMWDGFDAAMRRDLGPG